MKALFLARDTIGFSVDHFGPTGPEAPVTQHGDTIHCRFDTPLKEAVMAHIMQGADQ